MTQPVEPTPTAGTAHTPDPVLDQGTYTAIKEPRSASKLALDGAWHQISRRYVTQQIVLEVISTIVLLAVGVFVQWMWDWTWVWIPVGVLLVVTVISLIILPRQARAYGYQLRSDDFVFRKGIMWQRMVAVPYGRLQLVDITNGPIDRMFGLAQLKLVTAAATSGVTLPGLTPGAADELRDRLIEVAETRRTGL